MAAEPREARTKYPVVVATDGLPLSVVPSAANVHDTRLLPHLLHLAQAVCAAIGRLYADAGDDSADNRALCLRHGIQPCIRKVGEPHGSGLGTVRCVVEHGCAWLLANKRLDRRQDRLGHIILALLTAACIFIIANRLGVFENRLLIAIKQPPTCGATARSPLATIRALDDLQRPGAERGKRGLELGAGIATVGEDVAQPREGMAGRGEQRRRPVAVLDFGRVHGGGGTRGKSPGDQAGAERSLTRSGR